MEAEDRTARYRLMDRLHQEARRFDFFVAARKLDAICREDTSPRARLGVSERPSQDAVRFCQAPDLHFSGTALDHFVQQGHDHPARLFVTFMGLLGPNGPMPTHITEYIHDREHNSRDSTLARFLDLFNHRMVSMFYRAWANSQIAVSRDRGGDDSFARFIGSLLGMGMESLLNRDSVPDDARIYYSGHLASRTCHSEGLSDILSDFFDIPARIRQFVGYWLTIPSDCRLHLGRSADTCTLGRTALLGSKIWECSQRIRVIFGPMSFKDYERILPGGASFRRIMDWVRSYTTDEFGYDVRMVLRKEEVPRMELGRVGRLGWSTWVHSQSFDHDPGDMLVSPDTVPGLRPRSLEDIAREVEWARTQSDRVHLRPDLATAKRMAPPSEPVPAPAPEPEPELREDEDVFEWTPFAGEDVLTVEAPGAGTADGEEEDDGVPLEEQSDPDLGLEEELPPDLRRQVEKALFRLSRLTEPGGSES